MVRYTLGPAICMGARTRNLLAAHDNNSDNKRAAGDAFLFIRQRTELFPA